MSIEQPVDPQLIEQTKQQIRSLVAEIAQLTKTDVAPEEFYGQFLPRVVSALAASGGAVWTLNPEGRLALQYQINIQETNLRESEDHQAQHGRLLYKVLSEGNALLVPPRSGPGDQLERTDGEPAAGNPTEYLLLLGLLKTDLENIGVVEVFQRSDSGATTQKGYLRFLIQMCELAGDFLKSHQLRHFSDRQTLWTQLEDFTRNIHISLDPREAAYTIANEGRRLIGCDRVTVAIRKGRKCYIEAVSGQDLFDKRSNTIRLLGKLATAVVASGDPIWYTGDTRDLPPQVEEALQEYIDEAHSKTVAVLPLRRPPPPEEDDPKKRVEREEPIGALIVEQIEDSRVTQSLTQRSDVVCQHSSTALANSLEHQNLFLMPLWRLLGKTRWIVEARTLPKTLSIGGAVLVLVLIFGLWPAPFNLEGKGTLEPVKRQRVFASVAEAVVDEIPAGIDHGAFVKKRQLLLKLKSTQVHTAMEEVTGKLNATREELLSVQRELATGKMLKPEERNRLIGRQSELKQTRASLEAQWVLCKEKETELEVHSPIDGQIITWDLRNRLRDRPVQWGDQLMEVADPSDRWRLELHMPENRMGHITQAQRELKDARRELEREQQKLEDTQRKLKDAQQKLKEAQPSPKDVRWNVKGIQPNPKDVANVKGVQPNPTGVQPSPTGVQPSPTGVQPNLKGVQTHLKSVQQDPKEIQRNIDDVQRKLKEIQQKLEKKDLDVSYILALEPGVTRHGEVEEIDHSAEVRGDEGNTVLIYVRLDSAELARLRAEQKLRQGAAVTAKVHCGTRPLGYVLLHDLLEFFQSKVWFKYF